eukprot:g2710.t1
MRFQTVAAAGVAVTAVGSVSGFVSPPPTVGPRLCAPLRHGVDNALLASSSAASNRAPTAGAAASMMSLRPSRKQRFPQWLRPGAAGQGLGRGLSLLRGAAAERDDDEEMYEYEDGEGEEYDGEEDLDRSVVKQLKRSATVFRQVSWLSWWAQTILSTVAFIILLFSNAVTNRSARGNILGNGVALALASLACSAASICWTWGYTLKAKGWRNLGTLAEVDDAQLRMRNSLKMGLYINVAGMLLALIGAEQIVGTLVAKVLYSQGFQPSVMVGSTGAAEVAQAQFRALDVFIVQANTNTLLSHFCSLAASLWLLARTPKLAKLAKGSTVDKCPSTVSSLRSLVPRRFHSTTSASTRHDDSTTLIAGLEPYIRTSITDRVHDGIYDTDTAHKSTVGGRIKRGEIRSPDICRNRKRFGEAPAGLERQQIERPAYYDTSTGFDAISTSSKSLPFPRGECKYDSYIRRGLGQTTGSAIGPGYYGWEAATTAAPRRLAFSNIERWPPRPSSQTAPNRGPWDDVKDAWGRGGYIESAVPRDCKSYLPQEILWYMNHLDLDHLGKESFETAMRRNPKRYAASFSQTEAPDWRVVGDPALGPGTYAVERAEPLTFPAPQGGSGDADPTRPSLPFRVRYTPFDTRRLAAGYKTLKPRFSTPRSALNASELSSVRKAAAGVAGVRHAATTAVAEKSAGNLVEPRTATKTRLTPAGKAAAVTAEVAGDPWRIGGRGSRFVRLERPSVLDPLRDGSRRRAAAATWRSRYNRN